MSRPRNILFVNHVGHPGGGAEVSMSELIAALNPQHCRVRVAMPAGGLEARLAGLGVPTHILRMQGLRRAFNPLSLAGYLLSLQVVRRQLTELIRHEDIDIVHANSTTAHLYAGLAARRTGVPLVWHCRDLVDLRPLSRRLFTTASRVVAISQAVHTHLRQYARAEEEKLVLVRNGIDLERFRPGCGGSEVRGQAAVAPDEMLVGMLGRLVPWKRHDLFLDTAAILLGKLPNLRFVIAGDDLPDGDGAYRQGLQRQARRLGLENRVLFAGHHTNSAALLDALDLLIHPTAKEPFGRVLVEAMAVGTPVVAVNASGPAEIVTHETTGLMVSAESAELLAEAALRILTDHALTYRLRQNANDRARSAFDIRRTARQIEQLYQELAPQDVP